MTTGAGGSSCALIVRGAWELWRRSLAQSTETGDVAVIAERRVERAAVEAEVLRFGLAHGNNSWKPAT